ncbi:MULTISPECIES: hypothetical protein [Bacillus]|uniref:hypothetical protein n=1 Tax=Bacillus TaxID=1386 RepID=UPI0013B3F910|nr:MULTISPECIES: hypothetical protein [Bacillus]MED1411129.1 hypothetical protein [Bacillus paramycoides]MED1466369.1 hypothetical protein [Bacillus paramycoides]MED1493167.1 hypothetical protein [Bacillus paramycoides]
MKKEKLLFWINITSMITMLSSIIYLAFAASIKKRYSYSIKKSSKHPIYNSRLKQYRGPFRILDKRKDEKCTSSRYNRETLIDEL